MVEIWYMRISKGYLTKIFATMRVNYGWPRAQLGGIIESKATLGKENWLTDWNKSTKKFLMAGVLGSFSLIDVFIKVLEPKKKKKERMPLKH